MKTSIASHNHSPFTVLGVVLISFCALQALAQPVWFSMQEGDFRYGPDSATVNTSGTLISGTYTSDCTFIRGYTNKTDNMNSQTELRLGTTGNGTATDFDSLHLLAGFDLAPLAAYLAGNAYSVNAASLILTHKTVGAGGSSGMAMLNTWPFHEETATWNDPGSGAPAGGALGTQIATKTIAGTTFSYPATQTWTAAALVTAVQSALANATNKQAAFLFKRGSESDASYNTSYVTDENTDPAFGGIDARPELQISVTILSNAPSVSVTAPDSTASEAGTDTGTFTISRTGPATNSLTVYFTLAGGAANTVDYNTDPAIANSIVLETGVSSTNILVQPLNDSAIEDNETVVLTVVPDPGDPTLYGIGNASSTVTILDDNDGMALVDCMFGQTLVPRTWSPNITASSLSMPGLNGGFTGTVGLYQSPPAGFWIQSSTIAADEASAISGNDYLGLAVAPAPGYSVTFTNLEISCIFYNPDDINASNLVFFVRSSLDNYSTTLGSITNLAHNYGGGWMTLSVPLGPGFDSRADQVQFRIYMYDDAGTTLAGPRVDNLMLRGVTQPLSAGQYQVAVSAPVPNAAEPNTPGQFNVIRYGSTASPLTVHYALSGTASNGLDYVSLPGTVTIEAGKTNALISVAPIDDLLIEGNETVVLILQPDPAYFVLAASSATVTISDDAEPAQFTVAASDAIAYERQSDLAAFFTVSRMTSDSSMSVNFTLGGDAVPGLDYISSATNSISFGIGETAKVVTITPVLDTTIDPRKAVQLTLLPGSGYQLVTQTNATAYIYDDDLPPATVLFSDEFNSADSATNYTILEAARDGTPDSSINFAYDYSADSIPPAPGSSDTIGLKLSANKTGSASAAAVNLITARSFSGNFALRFNLYVQWVPTANFSEHALAGINHSGTVVNWRNQSGSGFISGDGFWVAALNNDTDGSFSIYHRPLATDPAPVTIATRNRAEMAGAMNNPPFGAAGGLPGTFGCSDSSSSKSWVDCELSQVDNVVTFKVNGWPAATYTNASTEVSGHAMLGFMDSFDSLGPVADFAVFENLQVVQMPSTSQPVITQTTVSGGSVTLLFTASSSDTPASFKLQSSASVNGTFADDDAALISGSAGSFEAQTAVNGQTRFYRLRRN